MRCNSPREISRRSLLSYAGGALAMAAGAARAATSTDPDAKTSKLILLGTGAGPVLGGERGMTASVVTVGNSAYVIDCGYGAAAQMAKYKIPLKSIAAIFITHRHPDHDLDLGALLFMMWLQGRRETISIYGPSSIAESVDHLLKASAPDLAFFAKDLAMPPMPPVEVHEIAAAGAVMQDSNVRVASALVDHPPVVPALAYRFDLPDRSIVFSGDTAPTDAVARLAKGADILVHEASDTDAILAAIRSRSDGASPEGFDPQRFRDHIEKTHSSAEEAGRIAAAAGVKTLVLNHLGPSSSLAVPDEVWRQKAASRFQGGIVVGHDGLVL